MLLTPVIGRKSRLAPIFGADDDSAAEFTRSSVHTARGVVRTPGPAAHPVQDAVGPAARLASLKVWPDKLSL